MENKLNYAICIAIAVIGLLVMHFSATATPVYSLDASQLDKKVSITGKITSARSSGNHLFFQVNNETIVVFSDAAASNPHAYSLGENDTATFVGTVKEYKGDLELVAEEVRVT